MIMSRFYEYCYTKRDIMMHGTGPTSMVDKIVFRVLNYFANKY